jgi:hypothetical protein
MCRLSPHMAVVLPEWIALTFALVRPASRHLMVSEDALRLPPTRFNSARPRAPPVPV